MLARQARWPNLPLGECGTMSTLALRSLCRPPRGRSQGVGRRGYLQFTAAPVARTPVTRFGPGAGKHVMGCAGWYLSPGPRCRVLVPRAVTGVRSDLHPTVAKLAGHLLDELLVATAQRGQRRSAGSGACSVRSHRSAPRTAGARVRHPQPRADRLNVRGMAPYGPHFR